MKKLIIILLLTCSSIVTHAQTWLGVGNTLQRQTNGTYSNYRFNMGSPGFMYFYSKPQQDSLLLLYGKLNSNNVWTGQNAFTSGYTSFSDSLSGLFFDISKENGIRVYNTYIAFLDGVKRNLIKQTDSVLSIIEGVNLSSRIDFDPKHGTIKRNTDDKFVLWQGDAGKDTSVSNNYVKQTPFLGTLYNKSNFTTTSDFTANGATPSTSGGALVVTASNTTLTDFTKSVDLTVIGTTDYDKWNITSSFTAPTPSATTQGVWFGMRSSNTTGSNFSNSLAGIDVSNGVNAGTLYIRGGNNAGILYATSPTKLVIAAGDRIQVTVTRSLWTWTARAVNVTNPQADVTCTYTSTGPLISGMQNAGNFAIFTQTATPISINSFSVYTSSLKNPDIVILGNSKSMGKSASNYLTSLAGLLSRNFTVVNISGGGDGTAEILRTLPSAIALKPKAVILDGVGRNDIAAGVSTATTEANIASMVTQLQAAGIQVIINTGYYETTVDQSTLQAWAIANYPSITVDNLKATSADLSSMYIDNIHTTDVGYSITYRADIESGLLKSSYDLTGIVNQINGVQTANTVNAAPSGADGIPSYRKIVAADFASQTANTFLAAPNGSSGTLTFRAITKPDLNPVYQASATSSVDWNDATNNVPGVSPNINLGTASNGVGGSNYFFLKNEAYYQGVAATNNHFQWGFPYSANYGVWYRNYFASAFTLWDRLINATGVTGDVTFTTALVASIKASVALTGTPTAPTAAQGTNTTQIATTAYVDRPLIDNILAKTANYTIVAGDFAVGKKSTLDLYVDATAGNVTITMPSATTFAGYTIFVTKTDASANTVTINTVTGGNTLVSQYQSRQFNAAPSIGWVNH